MRRMVRRLILFVALAGSVVTASPARAEWFADLYLGLALTSNTELTFTTRLPRTFEAVEFDNSPVWGGRVGYWFTDREELAGLAQYLGAALDLAYYRPRIPAQVRDTEVGPRYLGSMDLAVATISPVVLARWPLMVTAEFPRGRLQPYAMLGPTIFVASTQDSGSFGPRGGSETDTGLGIVAGPGVAWHLNEQFAVFAEYRIVHFSPSFDFTRGPVDLEVTTHQLNIGVSYRF